MTRHPDELHRFLSRLHARWVLVRAFERAGLCALVGSAAGLVLVPILIWRGQPALPVALGLIVAAAVVGLMLGLTRRPGRLAAAVEADRQLDLHDLLATALLATQRATDDAWSAAVVQMAQQRVRSLSPSSVILQRLGARAWGGIGLSAALVLTMSALSIRPSEQVARAQDPENRRDNRIEHAQTPSQSPMTRSPAPAEEAAPAELVVVSAAIS